MELIAEVSQHWAMVEVWPAGPADVERTHHHREAPWRKPAPFSVHTKPQHKTCSTTTSESRHPSPEKIPMEEGVWEFRPLKSEGIQKYLGCPTDLTYKNKTKLSLSWWSASNWIYCQYFILAFLLDMQRCLISVLIWISLRPVDAQHFHISVRSFEYLLLWYVSANTCPITCG